MAGLVLITGIALLSGCGKQEHDGKANKPVTVVAGVQTVQIAEEAIGEQVEVTGTVRAKNLAVISSRLPGAVSAVLVKEGDRVTRGKLLVTVEARESTAGAAAATASVEEATRGVQESLARKKLADVTFERFQKLYAEQAVSRQEFDSRQMEKDVAAQAVARAEARLVQAKEGALAAGTLAGYTRITAPISGIVTAKQAEAGMTVFPGSPLVTVEEEGNYRLEMTAPESLLGKVKLGMPVGIAIDGISGEMTGKVVELSPVVDPATRTFIAKVEVAGKGLRSGGYGRARIPVGSRKGLLVPKSAVVERGALTSVWVVDKDKTIRMRLVRSGQPVGDRVEIISGLSAGERIVTGNMDKVVDGARIE
jgi:RND family efflux transporter MFP subunit